MAAPADRGAWRPTRRLVAGACLALLATGCRDADASGATTLRFWAFGREGEVVQELVRDFEQQNPGVRVHVQQIPWTAAHEKLLTAYVGDATPDLAQLGNTWVPEFEALNALAPLDSMVASSGAAVDPHHFFGGVWATNVVDGRLYGIPWYVDTRVLFYRRDLLADAGYREMPTTWAEWKTAMRRMKGRMGRDRYPILLPTNEWPQPVIFGLQAGSPVLKDGGRFGAFSDSSFRRAFEFYVGLFREGLAPSVSSNEIANRYQEFERGNVAMMITGPWEIGEFKNRLAPEAQGRWMTAPLPGPEGPGVSMAGGASLVLFRASEHKEAAWRLIEFLAQPRQQARFYGLTGNLPARREAWEDSALAASPYTRAFRAQLDRVVPLPKVPEWEQIATKVFEYGEVAVRGRVPVPQALARLDRDVNALLEKRRWMLDREVPKPQVAAAPAAGPRD